MGDHSQENCKGELCISITGSPTSESIVAEKPAADCPPPDFLKKLVEILSHENSSIIQWDKGQILIFSPDKLCEQILGKHFRHSKYTSFQRQLNYFGFKKRKGKGKDGCCVYECRELIGCSSPSSILGRRRRTPKPSPAPSASGSVAGTPAVGTPLLPGTPVGGSPRPGSPRAPVNPSLMPSRGLNFSWDNQKLSGPPYQEGSPLTKKRRREALPGHQAPTGSSPLEGYRRGHHLPVPPTVLREKLAGLLPPPEPRRQPQEPPPHPSLISPVDTGFFVNATPLQVSVPVQDKDYWIQTAEFREANRQAGFREAYQQGTPAAAEEASYTEQLYSLSKIEEDTIPWQGTPGEAREFLKVEAQASHQQQEGGILVAAQQDQSESGDPFSTRNVWQDQELLMALFSNDDAS